MANSKYEYVKSFELPDKIMIPNLIAVRIYSRHFRRFSEVHKFEKMPNDVRALKLINACAKAVMDAHSDIVFSYGFSHEFSFVFKKESKLHKRRQSKILSLIVSLFTALYTIKWKEYFTNHELLYPPSFHAQVIPCPTPEVLQSYLWWRQNECHVNNLFDTCVWKLVGSGKNETEAHEILKGTQKQEKNELLFQQFGLNYTSIHPMFRQGTYLVKEQVEEVIKYKENGEPVKRLRKTPMEYNSHNIAGNWNKHSSLVEEVGKFDGDIHKVRAEYIESFQLMDKLLLSTWIVVRIDGHHFHRFSDVHAFEKPNDEQALNLMNLCAAEVVKEFKDIVFAYGVSDEYSFVLNKESQLYQRHASLIVSVIVSFFSSMYVWKWNKFFPQKNLMYPPSFDGRAVCYPSSDILRDYLTWRQVDCHINNQYNTCYWMLVKSGKSKPEAQMYLKGTQTQDKNDLLIQNGIDYNALPDMFRRGSSVFWDKENKVVTKAKNGSHGSDSGSDSGSASTYGIVIAHCNIIDEAFWEAHPWILNDNFPS